MSEETQKHIDAIRLQFCKRYQTSDDLHGIRCETQLQNSNESNELIKLSQINRACATKIGIACKPERFYDNLEAVNHILQEFSNSLFYTLSLLPLFYEHKQGKWAPFFLQRLDSNILSLLSGSSVLCNDIDTMLRNERSKKVDCDRLRSVGMIWAACDSLKELSQKGQFALLGDSVRQSCGLIQDVLQDIEQWVVNPKLNDDFDLESESGEDDLESKVNENEVDIEAALKRMEDFIGNWKIRLKMIKLLFSSFAKSISINSYKDSKIQASILQKIYDLQKDIVAQVDELISDFFLSDVNFDPIEFELTIKKLNGLLSKIIKLLRNLNRDDIKKSKWLEVWENKYFVE